MGPSFGVVLTARFLNVSKCRDNSHHFFKILLYYCRWNNLTQAQQDQAYPPVAPNFIIELHSQSDSPQYIHNKMLRWINGGVEVSRQTMMTISFI